MMNVVPITKTKLLVPRPRSDMLSRPRLLEMFYENILEWRLALLTAPAGYGKTTLLVDLAHQIDLPFCWYALDGLDREPRRFITYFVAAIAERFPNFGQASLAALQNMGAFIDWDRLVTAVVNDAFDHIHEHFILVLDDFHFVDEDEDISEFLNLFLQQVDENCHVIIASRRLIALPDLPLMVARSQVGGLDFSALAFQAHEIRDLLLHAYGQDISEAKARLLAAETEGWITGLLLSAQITAPDSAKARPAARVSRIGPYEYLAQQVLEQQPQHVRAFLCRSALLEEFNADLCREILEEIGSIGEAKAFSWQALIDEILERNLFVQQVGEGGRWLRYHHLFQQFLQEQMAREHAEEYERILRRLAAHHAAEQQWERARQIYQQLGDPEAVAALIVQAGQVMLYAAQQTTLAWWIDDLPDAVRLNHPELTSLRATAAVDLGAAARGLDLHNLAVSIARERQAATLLANALARRSGAHRVLGHYQDALNDADEVLGLTGDRPDYLATRAIAHRAKGLALKALGRLPEAINHLRQSQSLNRRLGNATAVAMLDDNLGIVYRAVGNYEQAQSAYERALAYWRANDDLTNQAQTLNNLGVLYHLMGEYLPAGKMFEEAVIGARQIDLTAVEARSLTSIGDLYADLDAPDAALAAYLQARQTVPQDGDSFLHQYLNLSEARIARQKGELIRAEHLLQASAGWLQPGSYEYGLFQLEWGRLHIAGGDGTAAAEALQRAVHFLASNHYILEAACAFFLLATACLLRGRPEETRAALIQTFELAGGLRYRHGLVVIARETPMVLEVVTDESHLSRQAAWLRHDVRRFEDEIPHLRRELRPQITTAPFAPPSITVRTLGTTQVEVGGTVVTRTDWQSPMALELLLLLLAYPEGLTKEAIGLMLWPDTSPANLKINFKKSIYRLRRAVDQAVVTFDEATDRYRFNTNLDYHYDVATFRLKVREGQLVERRSDRVAAYEQALAFYAGPYLPEIEREWALFEREALAQIYRQTALELAELYLVDKAYERTLAIGRRLLDDDPYLEEAHRLIMRLHAAQGNLAAVAQQYELCRRTLHEEMSIQPSAQTVNLFRSLTQSN
jgi:LuxR family transcriptional regulator, maltose regulon positive regulatory protein